MYQHRLTDFFATTKKPSNHFREFIYEPANGKAFFANSSPDGAHFVTAVSNIRLWYVQRGTTADDNELLEQFEFAINITSLLKSHLQKSIRQQRMTSAIRTAYTMCITSPADILRRLPVIAIEDVELVTGTSVIVWLMMTVAKRQLTILDTRLILAYVERLVATTSTFRHDRIGPDTSSPITHQSIVAACVANNVPAETYTELLAFYYRTTYGGMQGDIRMMTRALELYLDAIGESSVANSYSPPSGPRCLVPYHMGDTPPELMIPSSSDPDFVMASIDFHCYPWMLRKIAEKIGLTQARVKQLNWFCDSSVNERKDWTKQRARQNAKTDDWKAIKPQLEGCRGFILRKIDEKIYEDDGDDDDGGQR